MDRGYLRHVQPLHLPLQMPIFGVFRHPLRQLGGNLAPQLIHGKTMMVIVRSRFDSIVLVAITAGTVQPKPSTSGTKDLP